MMIRNHLAKLTMLLSLAFIATASPPSLAAQQPDAPAVSAAPRDSVMAKVTSNRGVAVISTMVGLCLIGAVRQVTSDKDSAPATQTSRQQLNNAVRDLYYFVLHRPGWQVAAAAVAPPVLNIGTTTSKVKTTATTQLWINGVVKSLTATDDLWTLTGGNLAIGSVRRYLMLWDGTSATTVVSVLASNDQVIASYASAAAALLACRFPTLPPAGTVIVGIVSITNVTNAFIPGTTALTATGVTAAYLDGIDDSVFQSATINP